MRFFRQIVAGYRVWQIVAAITLVSVMLSVGITMMLDTFLLQGTLTRPILWVTVFIPIIVVPLVSYSVVSLMRELHLAELRLIKLTRQDELTGVSNRRYFQEQVEQQLRQVGRTMEEVSLLMLDADDFKQVNDSHGHAMGDLVLKEIASICREKTRETDIIGRFGGEEFLILLIGCDEKMAMAKANEIRVAISEQAVSNESDKVSVSVSMGLVSAKGRGLVYEYLFAAADQALYQAKAQGKNQVTTAALAVPVSN